MKRRIRHGLLFAGAILLAYPLGTLSGCEKEQSFTYEPKMHASRVYQASSRELTTTLTLGGIGDILIHDRVYEDAETTGGYDFEPAFSQVKEIMLQPDILTANQESLVGGAALGVSSYPMFNSPHEVADALLDAGVDIVSTANNHSLDKKERGIQSQIAYLNKIGMPYVGSFIDETDKKKLRILKKNGIKLAFLSYTYGTNGIPVPEGKNFLVNLIDKSAMKTEVAAARKQADVVVMSIHWGNEYQRFPTDQQKDIARFLADSGVDIIFGSHPHVLQPMEWLKTDDGRKTLVVYSLGNFISGQIGDYKDIGGIATVQISKQISAKGSKIILDEPKFQPTFVYRKNARNFRVVPMEKTGHYGIANPAEKTKETIEHMNQWLR